MNYDENKFGIDLFGKKRIAFLERQLEDIENKTGWCLNRKREYEGLPKSKISDDQFIKTMAERFHIKYAKAKTILDWIEEKIPEEISRGKKAIVWQGMGTFYSVQRRGRWQPRVRFHKTFKEILNKNNGGEK